MDHDHSYKALFSHPEMVADLLRGFVREEWAATDIYHLVERSFSTEQNAKGQV